MNCMYRMHQRGVLQGVIGSFLLGLAGLVAAPATAGVVFKITFDNADVQTPAPAAYIPGSGEISFPGYGGYWTNNTGGLPIGHSIEATPGGLQGGRGLRVPGGGWGTAYSGYHHRGGGGLPQLSLNAAGKGFTMEISCLFSNRTGQLMASGWNIYPALSTTAGSGNNMTVTFSFTHTSTNATTPSLPLADGKHHHIAAVYTLGAIGALTKLQVYVDRVLVASNAYLETASYYLNAGDSAVGKGYNDWPYSSSALIDAAALSDTPLEPAAFVLPTSAPATKGTVVLIK